MAGFKAKDRGFCRVCGKQKVLNRTGYCEGCWATRAKEQAITPTTRAKVYAKEYLSAEASKIIQHIEQLNLMYNSKSLPEPYQHMGATLAEAILQSGQTYETVIKPRIDRIRKEYATNKTTSDIVHLINEIGASTFLQWNDSEKINRFTGLLAFCNEKKIETEKNLAEWISTTQDSVSILDGLSGIGPKTIDYIKILVGIDTIAIDRHILRFALQADVKIKDYYGLQAVYEIVAEEHKVTRIALDNTIWNYMSSTDGKTDA